MGLPHFGLHGRQQAYSTLVEEMQITCCFCRRYYLEEVPRADMHCLKLTTCMTGSGSRWLCGVALEGPLRHTNDLQNVAQVDRRLARE